jgi:uncharacterized protein YbjT (DUF2867 family)
MRAMARIALTGVTGEIGGRVARRLDQSGIPLRLVVRDPARAPEISDADVAEATGPEALSMDEVAAALATVVGRPVTYQPETVDEAYASRSFYGAPQWEVDGWISSYAAIAGGEIAAVTDHVEAVAGHPATSFAETLARHPELTAHLNA